MEKAVYILMFSLLIGCSGLFAQQLTPAAGKVEVMQDDRITQLSDQYKKLSINNPSIDGYRVQIFFDSGSNSKNKASGIKDEFQLSFPNVKAYLTYKEPYYRVKVGNFRTLIEAVGFQKEISAMYPNSFAVKDKITF